MRPIRAVTGIYKGDKIILATCPGPDIVCRPLPILTLKRNYRLYILIHTHHLLCDATMDLLEWDQSATHSIRIADWVAEMVFGLHCVSVCASTLACAEYWNKMGGIVKSVPGRKEGKKCNRDVCNTCSRSRSTLCSMTMRFAMHRKEHIRCSKTCLIRGQEAVWCTVSRVE
jgi:hypothetical protein